MLSTVIMMAVIKVDQYVLESIYITAFLLACLAMALLGRWKTRGLMLFIVVVAVLLVCCKTARDVYRYKPQSYTVAVPV